MLFHLNCKHPNITFTCEIEKDRSLVFLDIDVYKVNNKSETWAQSKSTFSRVYTNYTSISATGYKRSLITTMSYKSFIIVSDYQKLHQEIVKLNSVLRENGYLTLILDKTITKFLDKSFKRKDRHCHSS